MFTHKPHASHRKLGHVDVIEATYLCERCGVFGSLTVQLPESCTRRCRHCEDFASTHVNGQCLFAATRYEPWTDTDWVKDYDA